MYRECGTIWFANIELIITIKFDIADMGNLFETPNFKTMKNN